MTNNQTRMTAKTILHTAAARAKLLTGVDTLAKAVNVTLGPYGKSVLLEGPRGAPSVTREGARVADAVELSDRMANLGARLVREAAETTRAAAGGGATTAIVLAQAIYKEGARLVVSGHDPIDLKRGIERAVACVVGALVAMARPFSGRTAMAQLATMSANGDQDLGDKLADALERVGQHGFISIEESQGTDTSLTLLSGMRLDSGYLSPYFVTDTKRLETRYEDALVLVSERKLSTTWELVPLLERLAKAPRQLLIVADDVDGDALSTLIVNKLRGAVDCVAVKAPSFGTHRKEVLRDVAALTGAQSVSEELGLKLEDVTLPALGRAQRVTVDKDSTTIVGGDGSREIMLQRAASLRSELGRATAAPDQARLGERIAGLVGGVAVFKIGGHTKPEIDEKKARAEDALRALRSATQAGVVAGSGIALLRAQPALDMLDVPFDQRAGVEIVRRALEAPLWQIAHNGGGDGRRLVAQVRALGDDLSDGGGDALGGFLSPAVLDPLHVVRSALQNAASVATLLLMSECLIAAHLEPG